MDSSVPREGASNMRPPFFDRTDYAYWKARMITHLSSLGIRVWRVVQHGYEPPTVVDSETKLTREKLDSEWSILDNEKFEANSKALGAIYGALNK